MLRSAMQRKCSVTDLSLSMGAGISSHLLLLKADLGILCTAARRSLAVIDNFRLAL